MNAFFDGINVTNLCTQLTANQYTDLTQGKVVNGLPNEGTQSLVIDNEGFIYLKFRIPEGRFRTGERKFVIADALQLGSDNLSSVEDVSTIASGDFFADGTKQVLQRTIYSTKGYKVTSVATYESSNDSVSDVLPNTWVEPEVPAGGGPDGNGGGGGHCCFDPNAKVLMADFTYKRIIDIQPGEKVIGADGFINTVIKLKKTTVQRRKMVKFRDTGFYSTNDHLFLTDKGWKTWTPETLIAQDAVNVGFLEGENRVNSIDNSDKMKVVEIVDGKVVEKFVDYSELGAEIVDFDSDYEVYDLTLDGNATYIVEGYIVHNCCVAYTVFVKIPNDEEGLFCTGFDFFIQRKSQTRGMWFELREMDKAGNITTTQIPGTEKRYTNSELVVSADGITNPMQVRFDSPVFLFNNTDYAFVIHSDSPSGATVDPDTVIWIARLGEEDKNTGTAYSDRQRKGKFYSTTNNRKWDVVEDVDIPLTVHRADFTTTLGTIVLGNKPVEKLTLKNVSSSLSSAVGDYFSTGDRLTITTANGTNTISVGDRFYGNTSLGNANGYIVSISNSIYTTSNTKYQVGEKIDVYDANGSYKGITANVATVANTTAILNYYDESSINIYSEFINSTGGFALGTIIRSVKETGYDFRAEVDYIDNFKYSTVSFEPKVLDFIKTDVSYEMKTTSNSTLSVGSFNTVFPSETTYLDGEKVLLGRTDELTSLAGSPSNQLRVTMSTLSRYVSPVFDLDSSNMIYINNLINDDTTGENGATGGKAYNKYISQTITLADGQDAEDLKVYLTAYRPPNTDVHVYLKLLNASDPETFAQKLWIPLEKENNGDISYSSISDRQNFKEFTYKIPDSYMTGADGQFQYTLSGATYTGFKYFAVKIVLTSTNSAVVPRVSDLRAIALQM